MYFVVLCVQHIFFLPTIRERLNKETNTLKIKKKNKNKNLRISESKIYGIKYFNE